MKNLLQNLQPNDYVSSGKSCGNIPIQVKGVSDDKIEFRHSVAYNRDEKKWERVKRDSAVHLNDSDDDDIEYFPITEKFVRDNCQIDRFMLFCDVIVNGKVLGTLSDGKLTTSIGCADITINYVHEFQHILRDVGFIQEADNIKI
jgi:hypothetical protein